MYSNWHQKTTDHVTVSYREKCFDRSEKRQPNDWAKKVGRDDTISLKILENTQGTQLTRYVIPASVLV